LFVLFLFVFWNPKGFGHLENMTIRAVQRGNARVAILMPMCLTASCRCFTRKFYRMATQCPPQVWFPGSTNPDS